MCGKHQRRNSFLLFIYLIFFFGLDVFVCRCVCRPALTHCVSHSHLFDFHFFSLLEIFSLPRVFSLWNTWGGGGELSNNRRNTHKKKKKKNRKMTVEFIKWWDISIGKKITKLKARVRAERELEIANCVFLISFRFYVLIDCLSFQRCESIICIQDLKGSQLKEPTSSRYYTFINFYIYLCI